MASLSRSLYLASDLFSSSNMLSTNLAISLDIAFIISLQVTFLMYLGNYGGILDGAERSQTSPNISIINDYKGRKHLSNLNLYVHRAQTTLFNLLNGG